MIVREKLSLNRSKGLYVIEERSTRSVMVRTGKSIYVCALKKVSILSYKVVDTEEKENTIELPNSVNGECLIIAFASKDMYEGSLFETIIPPI